MADNQIYFRNRGLFNLITLFFFFLFFLHRFRFLGFFEDVEFVQWLHVFQPAEVFQTGFFGIGQEQGIEFPVGLVNEDDVRDFPFVDHDTDVGAIGGVNTNDVSFIIGEVDGFPITVHVHHVEFVIPEITGHISPFEGASPG